MLTFAPGLYDDRNYQSQSFQMTFVNRPALWMFPSKDFPNVMKNTFLKVSPKGLNNVLSMSCGSVANENAFKIAFMHHMRKERGGIELPPSDDPAYSSVMQNLVSRINESMLVIYR